MGKSVLAFSGNRSARHNSCIDPVVGDILSGWRYDISGLSPAMRTDYEQHLANCAHCSHRQNVARTIEVLLISISTLSIVAFFLAAVVIRRVELITHFSTIHGTLKLPLPDAHVHVVAISLEAVAITGLLFSTLLWILVAITTPLPGFLGEIVQQRIPTELLNEIRGRFHRNAA
jgi:hypothetical protein